MLWDLCTCYGTYVHAIAYLLILGELVMSVFCGPCYLFEKTDLSVVLLRSTDALSDLRWSYRCCILKVCFAPPHVV